MIFRKKDESEREKSPRKRGIVILAAAIVLVLVAGIAIMLLLSGNDISATTIRIIRFIGGVELEDEDGSAGIREDMRLHNGNVLTTENDGSVDLNLDDTKAAGLDVNSRANFTQEDKALTINVEEGALYFYTSEKLGDDETFDIKTNTMIVGIRGTSGYLICNSKNGVTRLYLTSGTVHITGTNPKTGGTNETDVSAGQSVQTYLYNYLTGKDSIQFVVEDINPEDVPSLLMQKIVENDELFEKVAQETGWFKDDMQNAANNSKIVNASVEDSTDYADWSAQERTEQNDILITAYDSKEAAANGDKYSKKVAKENGDDSENAKNSDKDKKKNKKSSEGTAQKSKSTKTSGKTSSTAKKTGSSTSAKKTSGSRKSTGTRTASSSVKGNTAQTTAQPDAAAQETTQAASTGDGTTASKKTKSKKKNSGSSTSSKKKKTKSSSSDDDDEDDDDDDDDDDDSSSSSSSKSYSNSVVYPNSLTGNGLLSNGSTSSSSSNGSSSGSGSSSSSSNSSTNNNSSNTNSGTSSDETKSGSTTIDRDKWLTIQYGIYNTAIHFKNAASSSSIPSSDR